MPKHSKNNSDRGCFTYYEKNAVDQGSISQRLGVDSQLPFGYCCLSLTPVVDPVVSPSGHVYSREAIIEYLLTKTQEIKRQNKAYELQQAKVVKDAQDQVAADEVQLQQRFIDSIEGVKTVAKRKASEIEEKQSYMSTRQKIIDDTDDQVKLAQLKQVAPWIPQFTPEAKESLIKPPPRYPSSPMSGRPLRTKDLIPINMEREVSNAVGANPGPVRFMCPVSSKTITNQKVILIKSTGVIMLESVAQSLALKTMTCPITGKSFTQDDILELVGAASAFAASGAVEATKYRPTMN